MTRKALGRGLSALIPGAPEPAQEAGRASRGATANDYFLCPIERIRLSKTQPRQRFDDARLTELASSIREQGVIQPLVVRPGPNDTFLLVAGERRWRAAQKAGLHEVPVVIRKVSDLQAVEVALVENLQREDLNPIEEAQAYSRLIEEHGYTQEQLADRLGRDRSTVANSLRLLKLPKEGQSALVSGSLSAGHARALLGIEDANVMRQAIRVVIDRQLSVRQTEELVRSLRGSGAKAQSPAAARAAAAAAAPSANVRDLQEKLSRALKVRVRLVTGARGKGRIEISYSSLDELDRLLEVLLG